MTMKVVLGFPPPDMVHFHSWHFSRDSVCDNEDADADTFQSGDRKPRAPRPVLEGSYGHSRGTVCPNVNVISPACAHVTDLFLTRTAVF